MPVATQKYGALERDGESLETPPERKRFDCESAAKVAGVVICCGAFLVFIPAVVIATLDSPHIDHRIKVAAQITAFVSFISWVAPLGCLLHDGKQEEEDGPCNRTDL